MLDLAYVRENLDTVLAAMAARVSAASTVAADDTYRESLPAEIFVAVVPALVALPDHARRPIPT